MVVEPLLLPGSDDYSDMLVRVSNSTPEVTARKEPGCHSKRSHLLVPGDQAPQRGDEH